MAKTITDLDINTENFITDLVQLAVLLLAGASRVTIANLASGTRFAYHIRVDKIRTEKGGWVPSPAGPWHVECRTEFGWMDLCCLVQTQEGIQIRAASNPHNLKMGWHTPEFKAFKYMLNLAVRGSYIPPTVRIWSSERCCRCGANLISDYRHLGVGPECCHHYGLDKKVVRAVMASRDDNERVELFRDALYEGKLKSPLIANMARLCPEGIARQYIASHAQDLAA